MFRTIVGAMPPFKFQKAVLTRIGHQSSGVITCCTQKRMLANALLPFTPNMSLWAAG